MVLVLLLLLPPPLPPLMLLSLPPPPPPMLLLLLLLLLLWAVSAGCLLVHTKLELVPQPYQHVNVTSAHGQHLHSTSQDSNGDARDNRRGSSSSTEP
jgi:hypothetical protein